MDGEIASRVISTLLSELSSTRSPVVVSHTWSASPATVLSIAELADALHGWLDVCQIHRAAFVGNSFGCQIIVDLAMRYPERVDRLVLLGATIDAEARNLPQQCLRMYQDICREPPARLWHLVARAG